MLREASGGMAETRELPLAPSTARSRPMGPQAGATLSDRELLETLRTAMAMVGMTLMREQLTPFERAFAAQLERLLAARARGAEAGSCAGPWWVGGSVVTRDDKPVVVRVEDDFAHPQQRRQYLARLCEALNRAGPLLD